MLTSDKIKVREGRQLAKLEDIDDRSLLEKIIISSDIVETYICMMVL